MGGMFIFRKDMSFGGDKKWQYSIANMDYFSQFLQINKRAEKVLEVVQQTMLLLYGAYLLIMII